MHVGTHPDFKQTTDASPYGIKMCTIAFIVRSLAVLLFSAAVYEPLEPQSDPVLLNAMFTAPRRPLALHNFLHNVSAPSVATQRRRQQTTWPICLVCTWYAPSPARPGLPLPPIHSASSGQWIHPPGGYRTQEAEGGFRWPPGDMTFLAKLYWRNLFVYS